MAGTPSRTATASGGGVTRVIPAEGHMLCRPRGDVGRKLQAKPWPEEHEPHEGDPLGVRELGISKPDAIRTGVVVVAAGRWGERHAPYPGRSVGLLGSRSEQMRLGRAGRIVQARAGKHTAALGAKTCAARFGDRLGKPQGRPMGRQKSAEAKVATAHGGERAEHSEPNRRGAFDG